MLCAKRIPIAGNKSKTYLFQIRVLLNISYKLLNLRKIMGWLGIVPTIVTIRSSLLMSLHQNLSSVPSNGIFGALQPFSRMEL